MGPHHDSTERWLVQCLLRETPALVHARGGQPAPLRPARPWHARLRLLGARRERACHHAAVDLVRWQGPARLLHGPVGPVGGVSVHRRHRVPRERGQGPPHRRSQALGRVGPRHRPGADSWGPSHPARLVDAPGAGGSPALPGDCAPRAGRRTHFRTRNRIGTEANESEFSRRRTRRCSPSGTEERVSSAWISTAEAAQHLGVTPRTLLRMAAQTPQGTRVPYTFSGWGRRTYRWRLAGLDTWAEAIGEWHRSQGEESGGPSGGETRTAGPGRGRAARGPRRRSSGGTSSPPSGAASAGNLAELARSLS